MDFEEIKLSFDEGTSDLVAPASDFDSLIYPVWKDSFGPKNMDNLKGIHVPVIDGTEILLFPKYKYCTLLPEEKIKDYNLPYQENPLYSEIDQITATDKLLELNSDAAKFVRSFGMHIALPIQLLAIAKYKDEIDKISKSIGGDLLCNVLGYWWSSVRYNTSNAWIVNGSIR